MRLPQLKRPEIAGAYIGNMRPRRRKENYWDSASATRMAPCIQARVSPAAAYLICRYVSAAVAAASGQRSISNPHGLIFTFPQCGRIAEHIARESSITRMQGHAWRGGSDGAPNQNATPKLAIADRYDTIDVDFQRTWRRLFLESVGCPTSPNCKRIMRGAPCSVRLDPSDGADRKELRHGCLMPSIIGYARCAGARTPKGQDVLRHLREPVKDSNQH